MPKGIFKRERDRHADVILKGDPEPADTPLTPKEEDFANAFVVCRNLTTAYRIAYGTHHPGASPGAIHQRGHFIANKPHVAARIQQLRDEASAKTVIKARELIQDWHDIASTDPGEIMRVETQNCRHCHGLGGRYQWADEDEYMQAVAAWEAKDEALRGTPPDPMGGFGFHVQNDPSPSCRECRGAGVIVVKITSTDKLSAAARKLYKGVKQTKQGIEVMVHDAFAARRALAETLGITSGKDPTLAAAAPTLAPEDATPENASVAYLEMLGGQ